VVAVRIAVTIAIVRTLANARQQIDNPSELKMPRWDGTGSSPPPGF
jgi:hypothetical protein